jgi:hypothetical protein
MSELVNIVKATITAKRAKVQVDLLPCAARIPMTAKNVCKFCFYYENCCADFTEPRFWIASGLPTTRELTGSMNTAA